MPVSRSIMTQASMGRAISRLLLFRCSSRAVPNAGFSNQESDRGRLAVSSFSNVNCVSKVYITVSCVLFTLLQLDGGQSRLQGRQRPPVVIRLGLQ